ncbi:AEC family transporter [Primorskyibacter sp. S187A]|uniref:AEC family transporter n=1 Tax=Primorskyibacter sp. S187A TaxID=3415130 RepID=UPI003C79D9B5
MNLALTVLNITAPVFLLGAVGYLWVRLGFEYRLQFVTRLAMSLAVPCLIFTALVETEIDPQALTTLTLASIATYGAITIAAWVLIRLMRLDVRTFLAPVTFGNTGNLGLPLALFAFGQEGLSLAVIVFAIMAIWSFTFGIWVVSGGGSLIRVIQEPLVAATLAGALFLWQGWSVPMPLFNAMDLIGQMAIPLMLITLGVAVARLKPQKFVLGVFLSVVKVALCAGLSWWIADYFELSPMAAAVLILQAATPVAVTSYMLAEKYGADSDAVAGLVVLSTVLSVLYLPLLLAVLL